MEIKRDVIRDMIIEIVNLKTKIKYSELFFISGIIFASIVSALTILGVTLDGVSDYNAHMNFARNYLHQLPYPTYHLLLLFFNEIFQIRMEYSSALILTVCNIVSILILRKIIYNEIDSHYKLAYNISDISRYLIDFFCISSIFIMTIPSVLTNNSIYIGFIENRMVPITSPNMWHNPTQLMVRPFQLVSLYFYLKIIQDVKNNSEIHKKKLAMFSIFSVLATLAKPVGNFVIMPALAIYAAIVLFRNFKERYIPSLRLLVAVLPIMVIMYVQYFRVGIIRGGGEQVPLEMQFHFGTIANLSITQVLSFAISNILFAVFVFATCGSKNIRSPLYCVGLITYLVGFFQFFFITDGSAHFNMGWSYMLGSYIIMICSIIPLIKLGSSTESIITKIVGYSIWFLHFIFGVYYIILYLNTGTFHH